MDFLHNLISGFVLFKTTKPDVLFLIFSLGGYFLFFLIFSFFRKFFKKERKENLAKKKDSLRESKKNNNGMLELKMFENKKDNLSVGFMDYLVGAKDLAHLIWIRKKINNNSRISIPLHQAVYLIRHYPEYFYYAGEKQKILFEKINKKIFESIEKKSIDLKNEKSSSGGDTKKIEFKNKSKVLVDRDGIIQAFISPEDENKEIAQKILNDFEKQDQKNEAQKIVESKKDDLGLKMKTFFENKPELESQKNKKSEEDTKQADKNTEFSDDESKPMTKKELKEKIKKEKREKEDSKQSGDFNLSEMEDVIDSILKNSDIMSTEKTKDISEETNNLAQNNEIVLESKNKTEDKVSESKKEVSEKDGDEKMSFDLETSSLVFLREKVKKEDFGKSVFLLDQGLVFYKEFFEEFLKTQNADSNQQEVLLKRLIRKFELSYDIEILSNQLILGTYKDQEINGKFYVLKITQDERKSIAKNIY